MTYDVHLADTFQKLIKALKKKYPHVKDDLLGQMNYPAASCEVSLAEFRRSLTRLRAHELRRGRLAIPLCSKLQSILAKANESLPSGGLFQGREDRNL